MGIFDIFKPNVEKLRAKKDVKGLIKALKDEESYIQREAAEALGEIGDARAVEPLIDALKDEDKHVRWEAAYALDKIGWQPRNDTEKAYNFIAKSEWDKLVELGKPAVEALIYALKDKNKDVGRKAVYALIKIGDARAVEPLIDALKDKDKDVRTKAAEVLGEIGDARAVEPLIDALKYDVDEYVPRTAAAVLGKIGDARAVEPLIQALRDEEDRDVAAYALGEIGDARAVEPLIDALKYKYPYVREAARGALDKIKAKKS